MFLLAVILVGLALLFFLTALALWAAGLLRHPWATAAAIAVTLAVGLVLLAARDQAGEDEFGAGAISDESTQAPPARPARSANVTSPSSAIVASSR